MTKMFSMLFILMCFITGFINESVVVTLKHDIAPCLLDAPDIADTEQNCEEQDCHEHESHFAHHCSGLHSVILPEKTLKLAPANGIESMVSWYLHFHYDEPFIDPALKPPLFS